MNFSEIYSLDIEAARMRSEDISEMNSSMIPHPGSSSQPSQSYNSGDRVQTKAPQKEEMPTPGERQKTVAQPVLTRDQYRIRKLTKENARLRWEVKERDSRISSLVECQDALKEDLAAEKKNAKAYRERLMFEKRDVDDLEAELRTARRKLNSLRVSLLDTDDERNWSDWEVDEQNEE